MPRVFAVTRARKHADHDQSDHGNWASGGVNNQGRNVVQLGQPYPTRAPHALTGYAEPESSVALPNGRSVDIQSGGDAVSGGYNGYFVMHDKETGERMGYLDYQSSGRGDDKRVQIAMVETTSNYRGQGVATSLLARLVAEFPEVKIEPGSTTEDGGRWWESVKPLLPSSSKSLKHGDHDQSDHGSWATGSSADKEEEERARNDPWTGSAISRSDAFATVNWYTGRGSTNINRFLRGTDKGANDADIQDRVDQMDAAFFRAPAFREEQTLFRGLSARIGEELVVGETFADKGFTSTTREVGVTKNFTGYGGGQSYIMQITVPAGTRAVEVELSSEKEVILNRGSEFQITGMREEGSTTYVDAILLNGAKSLKHLDGEHDQSDHGSWATGITGGAKLPAAEFAAKLVARAAESRGGKSGIQQLDLSNTSSFAEIKSASDTITSAIDKEMGKWPSMYAEPRVEPTEQQIFLKQFSDVADLMRNTLHSANEGEIGRNKDFQFFVATGVDGTTPVGTLVYRNFTRENVGNNPYLTGHEDKWMELTNIGTNGLEPGVGTRLVTQVLGAAAENGRGVWLNDPYDEAVGFYKELGFEMKYKQGDWIGYMEPETVQEWWKSYEAAGGK
jgi:ribosomal protein S18 acetylase RimI-like enzyme